MEKLRCIIVDDEEGAHLVLEHYFKDMKTLSLCGAFYNAPEAMDYLYHNQIDLIFLDINMPGLTGLEMLEAMSNSPYVVLTTAYTEFALEGYKYQVIDYLVKPFEFSKFIAAIDKVWNRKRNLQALAIAVPTYTDHLYLKVEGDIIKIKFEEIVYVQSWGNYIKVHTKDEIFLSPVTTTEIEEKLDQQVFMRIHKSYIVSLNRIEKISGAQVYLDNNTILPIGNTFKRKVQEHFK